MPPAARLERDALALLNTTPSDLARRVILGEAMLALDPQSMGILLILSAVDTYAHAGCPLPALAALTRLIAATGPSAHTARGLGALARRYGRRTTWGPAVDCSAIQPIPPVEPHPEPTTRDAVRRALSARIANLRGANASMNLPQCPLLSALNAEAFEIAAASLTFRQATDGEVIVSPGATDQTVFLVVSGQVSVRREDAASVQLGMIQPGGVFGEMSWLTGSPRMAAVVADGPVELLGLPHDVLTALGGEAVRLRSALSRMVCDRMLANLTRLCPLFQGLGPAERSELMALFESRLFEAGDDIITEGQIGRGVFVVLDGAVDVSRYTLGKKQTLGTTLVEGALFGELSSLQAQPAGATCTARRRTMVLFLPRASFESAERACPTFVQRLTAVGDLRGVDNIYGGD